MKARKLGMSAMTLFHFWLVNIICHHSHHKYNSEFDDRFFILSRLNSIIINILIVSFRRR
jgi:hypothetical protein